MSFAKKLRGKAPLDTLQRECFLNSCSANYKEKWKLWAQKQDRERHLKMDEKSRCFRALLKISWCVSRAQSRKISRTQRFSIWQSVLRHMQRIVPLAAQNKWLFFLMQYFHTKALARAVSARTIREVILLFVTTRNGIHDRMLLFVLGWWEHAQFPDGLSAQSHHIIQKQWIASFIVDSSTWLILFAWSHKLCALQLATQYPNLLSKMSLAAALF